MERKKFQRDDLMTPTQVCEELKLEIKDSKKACRRMMEKGKIAGFKLNERGDLRYSRNSVEAFQEDLIQKAVEKQKLNKKKEADRVKRMSYRKRGKKASKKIQKKGGKKINEEATEMPKQIIRRHDCGDGNHVLVRKTSKGEERFYHLKFNGNGSRTEKILKEVTNFDQAIQAVEKIKYEAYERKWIPGKDKKTIDFDVYCKTDHALYLSGMKCERDWKYSIRRLVEFFKGKSLEEIGPLEVRNYCKKQEGRLKAVGKGRVGNNTIIREAMILSAILTRAKDDGYMIHQGVIERNAFKKKNMIKAVKNERERILSEEEEKRLIETDCPVHVRASTRLSLLTGMRYSECLRLKWKNVNLETKEITIIESKNKEEVQVIPFNGKVSDLLKELKPGRKQEETVIYYHDPKTKENRSVKNINASFNNWLKKAGVEGLTFHDLRRTAGTRLIQRGVDLATVRDFLRHSSIVTTQRYLKPQSSDLRRAIELL